MIIPEDLESHNFEEEKKKNTNIEKKNTLTEPVVETIKRDLYEIKSRLDILLNLKIKNKEILQSQIKNYELWGPFLFIFLFVITTTLHLSKNIEETFSLILLIIIFGNFVLIINSKLLKTNISFLQGFSILGYCLFPLNLVSFFICIFHFLPTFLKFCLMLVGVAWSFICSYRLVEIISDKDKVFLVCFPLLIFYLSLGWFAFIE